MIEDEEGRRHFLEGVEHIPEHLLRAWTERIRAGETGNEIHGLALSIIHDFCLRQSLGRSQSQVTLQWLADVLEVVSENRDPKEILGLLGLLPRPKSRPPDPQRAIDVVWWLRSVEQRGYSASEAVELAAECFFKDRKSIERYRKEASVWAEGMNADAQTWERYFQCRRPPRPLPPPKTGSN